MGTYAILDHGVPREQQAALAGTSHVYCHDPRAELYDWVVVARVLAGENSGQRLTHAERVAYARLALERGDTPTAVGEALNLNSENTRELLDEVRTGRCYLERRVCGAQGCEKTFYVLSVRMNYCSNECRMETHRLARVAADAARAAARVSNVAAVAAPTTARAINDTPVAMANMSVAGAIVAAAAAAA